jgi:hypothetical protein
MDADFQISDAEMKALMIEVVNKVYTFISHMDDLVVLRDAVHWNRPEFDPALLRTARRRVAARKAKIKNSVSAADDDPTA